MHVFETKKVPRVLILCIKSYLFISVWSVGVGLIALALLTHISMPPNSETVCSTAALTSSSNRISVLIPIAFPPASLSSSAAVKIVPGRVGWGSVVFAAITIFAPSIAALFAIANPMPLVAPVINNVFPFNFVIVIFLIVVF